MQFGLDFVFFCFFFGFVFLSPTPTTEAGDKAVAVGGSKGRVPGSQTYTNTHKTLHQYYKPQHVEAFTYKNSHFVKAKPDKNQMINNNPDTPSDAPALVNVQQEMRNGRTVITF